MPFVDSFSVGLYRNNGVKGLFNFIFYLNSILIEYILDLSNGTKRIRCESGSSTSQDEWEEKSIKAAKPKRSRRSTHHPCENCDNVFSSSAMLKKHMRTEHNISVFQCKLCSFKSDSHNNLYGHQKSEHPEIFHCDVCEHVAATLHALKTHRRVEHEGGKYLCDQCDYITNLLSSLRKHKSQAHEVWKHKENLEIIFLNHNRAHLFK